MNRILVFGNSGSGKSTLAGRIATALAIARLDLDEVAWEEGGSPVRRPLEEAGAMIDVFVERHREWVIEGCYGDLIELLLERASEVIFLDLPVETCIENARNRSWEPRKYRSRADQDANLEMLVRWIADYPGRQDLLSRQAHESLYRRFSGPKSRFTSHQAVTDAGCRPGGRSCKPGSSATK